MCLSISHLKCNFLTYVDGQMINILNKSWNCFNCTKTLFPFSSLHDYHFHTAISNKPYCNTESKKETLVLNPPPNLLSLINKFNNFSEEIDNDEDNHINCKYYDINEMHKLNDSIKRGTFTVFHINASSLQKHFEEFEILLNSTKIDFDVIAVTESRILKDKIGINNLKLQNYNMEFCPTSSNAGGTVLYINEKHSYKPRADLSVYKERELESTFIEIVNPKRSNIIVGCLYRHPSMILSEFNDDFLAPLLEKLSRENKSIFLTGDFNVDLLKYNHDSSTTDFLDSFSSNSLLPHIIQPTRITNHSKTLIDNIFSNQISTDVISGNISATISDHLPQFLIAPRVFSDTYYIKQPIFERDWSNFDKNSFVLSFFNMNWSTIISSDKKNTERSFENFIDQFDCLMNKYAPLKKVSRNKFKFKGKPWITLSIQKSIKVKNKLFKKYITLKNDELKNEAHNDYKNHRNLLSTVLKRSKQNYYNNFFSKNIKNLKKTWRGINEIISDKNRNYSTIKSIIENGSTITDPKEIANSFNDYFTSVAENIQLKIRYSGKPFEHFLNDMNDNIFFLMQTNSTEIIDVINSLQIDKAVGPNSIPTNILKLLKYDISSHLAELFNLSFSTGIFPNVLKVSKIIPIHKKLSKLLCCNYRPISLLSNIGKIMERIMYNRLYNFFESNNLIYSHQFGFRQKFSTSYALIDLTENIKKNIDQGYFGCGIFVDFEKAFDTIDHNILINKLKYYGIKGKENEWFNSYLTNRKQFVCINGIDSDLQDVKCGVPQGSILGPLLFLVYINDLHKAIRYCKVLHFADDTNLTLFGKSVSKLNKSVNKDLKNLVMWLNANKISLNIGKTELVIFKSTKKVLKSAIKIKLNGKRIYETPYVKYLGVKIDQSLSWKPQIDDVAIKLNKANAMLSKIRYFVCPTILKNIYSSIFESHLNYCSIVWAQDVNSIKIKRLFTLQKKAIRLINFVDRFAHTNNLFAYSKVIKFTDRIDIENCTLISKYINNELPSLFNNWFKPASAHHSHHLRSSDLGLFYIPSYNTKSYGKLSIAINAAISWNKIQNRLKNTHQLWTLGPAKLKLVLSSVFIETYH